MYKTQHSSRQATSLSTLVAILLCGTLLILVTSLNVAAQARLIARDSVADLAGDEEGRVFWNKFGFTEGGEPWAVRRINTSTGAPTTLHQASSFAGLALASPYVFFFEGSNLMRMDVYGRVTESVARRIDESAGRLGTLTTAGEYVYWSDTAGIHRLPIDGGPQQDMLRPTHRAFWLAVDNTHIYWAGGITGYWEIRRARLSGGPSEQIYWSGAAISNLAVDETSVYWSQDRARVLRGPKEHFDTPSTIYAEARAGYSVGGLVVDRENIYWTELRDGTPAGSLVRRSPKDRAATVDLISGQGIQKLAQDPWNLYWSDSQGINQLPKRPAPTDAAVLSMEITQGIQNLNNDVPLVAQKPTIVRVSPTVSTDASGPRYTEVVLHGSRDGRALPESPLRSLAGVMSFPRATARSDVNSTANFVLPASWLSGNVRLTAEINPGLYAFPETDTTNNTLVRDVSFRAKEGMCVVTVPVISDTAPGSIYHISDPTFPSILARFSTIYPNADIRVRELPTPFGPVDVTGAAVHTITWLRPWMVFSDVGSCAQGARRVHAGLVSNAANTGNTGGFALPGQVAWVKMMTGGSAPHETPFGGISMAHEIAHTDWWVHIAGCGAGLPHDLAYPYSGGVLDDGRRPFGAAFESMLFFGFDRISMSVVPPSAFDFMGYCSPSWISDNHWRDLINSFANRAMYQAPDAPVSTVAVGFRSEPRMTNFESDVLYLAGIFGEDGSVTWGPTLRIPEQFLTKELVTELMRSAQQRRTVQTKSTYSIQLLGADDAVLLTQPFQPIPDSGDLPKPQPESFSVALPFAPGTTQIRLMKDKEELARINSAGSNAPVVRILSPKGGEEVSDTLKISWKIEGGNTSLPPFLVQYSNDAGATWQVLAMNHRALSLEVPTENLPGGKNCLVRVLASDPFTSSFSVSEPFRVITHAPFARISSPQAKQTFQTGEQILVRGFAYDVEDGSLNGKSMQWSIKGIGEIGEGAEALVPDLPPGRYSLILTVIDSEGQRSSTAEELVVVARIKQKAEQ